jgi:hypothetical protein
MEENKVPSASVLSKKRYHEIEEVLSGLIPDPNQHALAMAKICEIMKYDPTRNVYTPEVKERNAKWRRKKAEELGVTTYVTSGMKAYYERTKQVPVT